MSHNQNNLHSSPRPVDQREHIPISHSSIQSLPVPAPVSRFGAPLPALQDPRYTTTTSSGYEISSPTPAVSSISYSPFNNGFQPTSYPASITSQNFAYSLAPDSRPRIPSIQSPTSAMTPHNRSSSGSTKSVSPSLGSSVRSEYTTSTPGLARHLHTRPQSEILGPPAPHSPNINTSLSTDGSNVFAANPAGPPLGETQCIHHLSSADGHLVRPEIHARVDKGFFLSDRDWTCYRRNYFSVICCYSLLPATYSAPLYLRRAQNSAPEHILSFAMCISAVVDAPGGKTVELVQHTPKRDKGPQHKPAKVKLSPQPAGGIVFSGSTISPIVQQHNQQQLEHDYNYSQNQHQQQQQQQQAQNQHQHQQQQHQHQSPHPHPHQHQHQLQHQHQQQQPQHIAIFDRIQFKSATANNGKRRAAQQYYHLIVELYADVGSVASSAPGQSGVPPGDGGWVKIAYRISAPMVVRGRSPGHYADERRAAGTPSPGGGGAGGNQQIGGHHPGGPGFMGADGLGPPSSGGPNQGMSMQHINAPAPSAHQHSTAVSITGGSPASQYTPIDPTLKEEAVLHMPTSYTDYTYVPVHEPSHLRQPPTGDSGYEQNNSYNGDRKSEHPLDISCPQYENDVATYNIPSSIPTNMPPASDSYRSKDGQSSAGAVPWLGSGAIVGREQRFGQHNIFPKCGTFQTAETSKGFYPDISPL